MITDYIFTLFVILVAVWCFLGIANLMLLNKTKKTKIISITKSVFHFVSALLMPISAWIIFERAGFDPISYRSQSLLPGFVLITYLLAYFVLRKNIFTLLTIPFASWFLWGIVVFLYQTWPALGSITKILETFCASIAAYLSGRLLSKDKRTAVAGSAFYLLAAILMPIGLWVIFECAGFDLSNYPGLQNLISGLLTILYCLLYPIWMVVFFTWPFIIIGLVVIRARAKRKTSI